MDEGERVKPPRREWVLVVGVLLLVGGLVLLASSSPIAGAGVIFAGCGLLCLLGEALTRS